MPIEDKRTRRLVEREISKHPVDATLLRVRCINEVIYIDGVVREIRGILSRGVKIEQQMQRVIEAIETMPGVKDVVTEYRIG